LHSAGKADFRVGEWNGPEERELFRAKDICFEADLWLDYQALDDQLAVANTPITTTAG
jgi:hypothetical protein